MLEPFVRWVRAAISDRRGLEPMQYTIFAAGFLLVVAAAAALVSVAVISTPTGSTGAPDREPSQQQVGRRFQPCGGLLSGTPRPAIAAASEPIG